ncbi:hypothetical protein HYFRA_00013930 [Hymenoscyphus fraxineus]|uniref:Uncharacterized protein n=1 Tax=Hymenoscyphus fraxineus TaxID=746836 RepID=A0A9N9PZV1_9HELO|nr:hypothetical protein HYFRA_00013930 [Hymenoscyphus fraxineus]
MAIRTLEICASSFGVGMDIPTSAPLVRNQWLVEGIAYSLRKGGIFLNGPEAVVDGERRSFQIPKGLGEIVVGLFGEDEIGFCEVGHCFRWRGTCKLAHEVGGVEGSKTVWARNSVDTTTLTRSFPGMLSKIHVYLSTLPAQEGT